jgi:putative spermidine/putrescine transport system ATP-binding protein
MSDTAHSSSGMARGGLIFDGATKRYGPVTAVDSVTFALPPGQFVCFLGPSGCGKTSLLRLIAGLETIDGGRILLDGEDLGALPAERRNIGMVFQSLALFPHLSVGDNISYGLRIRGKLKSERRQRVEELLELVQLPGVADRSIGQLSGGQRQRIAIARALALEPRLFLLDEPLSALDVKLREAMQLELRQLQQRLRISTIMVTHDQREAMTMADVIVVMQGGRVQQVGSPLEIYRNPANRFVADFIGMANFLPATRAGTGRVNVAGVELAVAGEGGTLMVRPESVLIARSGPNETGLTGTVLQTRDLGASVEILCEVAGHSVLSVAGPDEAPVVKAGDAVAVRFAAEACRLLDA